MQGALLQVQTDLPGQHSQLARRFNDDEAVRDALRYAASAPHIDE